jgi:S1-C subfamily serine protease
MNAVDLVVIVLAVLAALRGWRRGFLGLVFELGGGFLGLVLGIVMGPKVAGWFTDSDLASALISLAVVFVFLSIGQTAGFIVGHRIGSKVKEGGYGHLNQSAGIGFGLLTTFLSVWLIGSVLVQAPSRDIARAVKRSTVIGWLSNALPTPPDVLTLLREYINSSGFPQVFAGFPRDIGPPVKLPTNALARRAVRAAQESTVRIVVPACGGTQLGTGWVAADSTVVTNAHVVAGGDEVQVEDSDGSHDGAVVLYDSRTDVAVIHVEGLAGPPLDLVEDFVERETPGATLGYPGVADGRLITHRAAVQAQFPAVGRDIYGRSTVKREVYEIRTHVREGDSGGPFVLPDGRVAGVIFAASTTDRDVGYALTGPEVSDEVEEGSQSSSPVGTGDCTH